MGKRLEYEIGVMGQKTVQQESVFGTEEGAGGVEKATTGADGPGRPLEEPKLSVCEFGKTGGVEPPSGIGFTVPDTASGAGGVHEDTVEALSRSGRVEHITTFPTD